MSMPKLRVTVLGFLLISLYASTASAIIISGKLILPNGIPAISAEMPVWVRATDQTGNNGRKQVLIAIPGGSASGDEFTFSLPNVPTDNGASWRLRYDCSGFPSPFPCENLVVSGFFRDTVPGNIDYRGERATDLAGDVDHTNLSMTLMKGRPLTGTLSLPDGVASGDGIDFDIIASSATPPTVILTEGPLNIPAGASGAPYQITLPDTNTESWTLRYACQSSIDPDCASYLGFGYFQSAAIDTTTEDATQAEALQGGADLTANMTLLTGYPVTGTIHVPTAVTEPGGLDLTIKAQNSNDQGEFNSTHAVIPFGATSVGYTVATLIDGSLNWKIRYECNTTISTAACSPYLARGYYDATATNTTGSSFSQATELQGGQSHSGIDMTLLSGNEISGRLKLSQGIAPQTGIPFRIQALNTSGSGGLYLALATIAAGASEQGFVVNVDSNAGKEWELKYLCLDNCSEITATGYYDRNDGKTKPQDQLSTGYELPGGVDSGNITLTVDSQLPEVSSTCFPIKTGNAMAVVCL